MLITNKETSEYIENAPIEEKEAFFKALVGLTYADGKIDEEEINSLMEIASAYGITNINDFSLYANENKILEEVKIIANRNLALQLIKELCILSHTDSNLSDAETLFIVRVGLAMNIELEKIEQISNWVIDHIIWLAQKNIIFEEDNI